MPRSKGYEDQPRRKIDRFVKSLLHGGNLTETSNHSKWGDGSKACRLRKRPCSGQNEENETTTFRRYPPSMRRPCVGRRYSPTFISYLSRVPASDGFAELAHQIWMVAEFTKDTDGPESPLIAAQDVLNFCRPDELTVEVTLVRCQATKKNLPEKCSEDSAGEMQTRKRKSSLIGTGYMIPKHSFMLVLPTR